MRERVTKRDKREFVRRCKILAERDGERINYHPARFTLRPVPWLEILWRPDEQVLHVRVEHAHPRALVNEKWSRIVLETGPDIQWGWIDKIPVVLDILRKEMVLDDLADL